MSIIYRRLKPKETGIYREIRLECLKSHSESFGSSYEVQAALPRLAYEDYIQQQTTDKFVMGAFDGDHLIGICSFSQESKEKLRHQGDLIQVYVKPAYKGQKVGYNLLCTIISEIFDRTTIEQLVITVTTANIAANKLYRQLGFKEFAVRPRYLKVANQYYDLSMMMLRSNEWSGTVG